MCICVYIYIRFFLFVVVSMYTCAFMACLLHSCFFGWLDTTDLIDFDSTSHRDDFCSVEARPMWPPPCTVHGFPRHGV